MSNDLSKVISRDTMIQESLEFAFELKKYVEIISKVADENFKQHLIFVKSLMDYIEFDSEVINGMSFIMN